MSHFRHGPTVSSIRGPTAIEIETDTGAGSALDVYPATVELYDALCNCQAQAGSRRGTRLAGARSIEALEDVVKIFGRDSGVLEADNAGFPNGRRPGDDVVDIELRVLMGALLPATSAPDGSKPFTDGALTNATIGYTPDGKISLDPTYRLFSDQFPYLQTPLSPSPQPVHP